MDDQVRASGEAVPARVITLAFPSGGQGLELNYAAGDVVETGALIAQVDRTAAEAALASARAAVAAAEAGVASAEAGLAAAEAQLLSARANLERVEDNSRSTDQEKEAAKAAVAAAEAGLAAANKGLESAKLGLEAAQRARSNAEQNLTNTSIYAPFDGVLVEVYAHSGEIVAPGAPLALLADLSTLQVETTDLNEVDVARVQVGDPVRISFDALPDVSVTGKVSKIALRNAPGAGVYFTVTVTLDEIPEGLRWGMSAFVEITVSE
ncbi:MAG: efflux RND transporter periplasmic adaptor subunit [Anaerolineales bacterium]